MNSVECACFRTALRTTLQPMSSFVFLLDTLTMAVEDSKNPVAVHLYQHKLKKKYFEDPAKNSSSSPRMNAHPVINKSVCPNKGQTF